MKIGNKLVLIYETMFIPDGETAEIKQQISQGDVLQLAVSTVFTAQPPVALPGSPVEEIKPIIRYEQREGVFHFTFENFTSSLGAVTNKPTLFCTSNKFEPIYYLAAAYRWQGITKIEMQVVMECAL